MENPYGIAALWQQSDAVIKFVGFSLLAMSLASWAVIFIRLFSILKLRKAKCLVIDFWQQQDINKGVELLAEQAHFQQLAMQGLQAKEQHQNHEEQLQGQVPLADWLTTALKNNIDDTRESLSGGLAILASVGSTSPFIGLFGTVWGIYHALVGIGVSGSASIDKVAGPVGEALIMTAFGLAVAIPAVLAYNAISRGNKSVIIQLNRFASQLHAYYLTGTVHTKAG
ncbi:MULTISPECIES: MotA/TolQ/ExbB proton channel family protein [unclassified Pseudoalteromonas]|uniref:MotA/TolQ/ExbB proton channel family protein n=1 Tax=unclassified Pseudoalteromonas TaxID=194690 RepID=UPI0025B48DC1|nr:MULTISPECIES: MotA/TolQ/ExbB proton channel family protein [unclassified Pseudoalteromonas]MDN3378677.1 MotA/TolQ/ExbB proton channel family protein [Pseudoalteromonas sp. APC 3893]MDN3387166.1 MotA/TolQ/ExbB proton channel family protein [Pseudoalteromonas sp. APC 4017]